MDISGNTYAVANDSVANTWRVFELTSTGARDTGETIPVSNLEADGSYLTSTNNGSGSTETGSVSRVAAPTINGSGNPVWGSATPLVSAVPDLCSAVWFCTNPPLAWMIGPPQIGGVQPHLSADGTMVINYDGAQGTTGFHLGAINIATGQWQWKTQLTRGAINGQGNFDTAVNYGGFQEVVLGHNIITEFHGEGYQGGQANQFMHYNDDGLMIGELGVPNIVGHFFIQGSAGNSFSPSLVQVGSSLYLYMNDESSRGVQVWQINNTSSIQETSSAVSI